MFNIDAVVAEIKSPLAELSELEAAHKRSALTQRVFAISAALSFVASYAIVHSQLKD